MTEYHEPPEELDARSRDFHRALTSLKEEIEAVDWYGQRVACASSPELKRVLDHNRKEEIEHACMTLEWLRREAPEWDAALRTYLFQQGDIVAIESEKEGKEAPPARRKGASELEANGAARSSGAGAPGRGLGVGSLREVLP
jgi:ferritin-like protein